MYSSGSLSGDVEAVVRRALELDASGGRADSLYAPGAVVVANARHRIRAPRFAGVGRDGRVTIAASNATVLPHVAWVLVDYRWFNVPQRQAEAGRATVVLERRAAGWRIVHAHSSQLLPWDR